MLNLLTERHVQAKLAAHSPDEVIDICGAPLVQSGAVEPRYVEAMKSSLRENGPYMVIVPGVALLHARPEDGVNELCISMATLAEAVPFGHRDNDPVRLAIAFGAVDHKSHIEALQDVVRLLSNAAALDEICQADTLTQILRVLQRVLA
jgi:mannitol operon transcriptional antiterminator